MRPRDSSVEDLPVAAAIFRPLQQSAGEKRGWQVAFFASLAVSIVLALSVVELAGRGEVAVHVVEMDRLGGVVYVGEPRAGIERDRYLVNELSELIRELKVVYRDRQAVVAERKAASAHLTTSVRVYLAEFYGRPENDLSSLLQRISLREVWIESVLPLGDSKHYQVRWEEIDRSRSGGVVQRSKWVAVIGVSFRDLKTMSREEAAQRLLHNPLGLFVTSLTWSRTIEEEKESS